MRAMCAGDAALVEPVDWRGAASGIVACVYCRRSAEQWKVPGVTAITGQWAKQRISIAYRTGSRTPAAGCAIIDVVASVGDRASTIPAHGCIGYDGVTKRRSTAGTKNDAIDGRVIAGKGAIRNGQRTKVVYYAAAAVCTVSGEGAVRYGQSTTVEDGATHERTIVEEAAACNVKRTIVVDTATAAIVCSVSVDIAVGNSQ